MEAPPRIATFAEFWPYYLGEHRHPVCRALHYIGTTVAGLSIAAALLSARPLLVLPAFASGYAFAWIGHFFVERNRPATFTYPVMSFRADLKLVALKVTGQLHRDPDFVAVCRTSS
jgi:hypothetical protein